MAFPAANKGMSKTTQKPTDKGDRQADKKARLADALRANLQRRKAARRARKDAD